MRRIGLEKARSRFAGVTWDKAKRKWRARITVDGKRRCLGRYAAELEAAQAYDAAKQQFYPDPSFPSLLESAEQERHHLPRRDSLQSERLVSRDRDDCAAYH